MAQHRVTRKTCSRYRCRLTVWPRTRSRGPRIGALTSIDLPHPSERRVTGRALRTRRSHRDGHSRRNPAGPGRHPRPDRLGADVPAPGRRGTGCHRPAGQPDGTPAAVAGRAGVRGSGPAGQPEVRRAGGAAVLPVAGGRPRPRGPGARHGPGAARRGGRPRGGGGRSRRGRRVRVRLRRDRPRGRGPAARAGPGRPRVRRAGAGAELPGRDLPARAVVRHLHRGGRPPADRHVGDRLRRAERRRRRIGPGPRRGAGPRPDGVGEHRQPGRRRRRRGGPVPRPAAGGLGPRGVPGGGAGRRRLRAARRGGRRERDGPGRAAVGPVGVRAPGRGVAHRRDAR